MGQRKEHLRSPAAHSLLLEHAVFRGLISEVSNWKSDLFKFLEALNFSSTENSSFHILSSF